MATAALTASDGISVGRVFGLAFGTVRKNPIVTISLALLFGGIPVVVFNYLTAQIPSQAMVMTFGSLVLPGAVAVWFVQLFLGQAIGVVTQGSMVMPAIAASEGRRALLGESLLATLKSLPSLIGLGVLVGTGIVIGTTLLIVPAFVIYLLWAVAAPALVAEREGVFLAITRSQELSEGARWKTLGVLAVPFAMSLLIGMVAALVARLLTGSATVLDNGAVGIMVLWVIIGTLANLMWSAIQAALYVELRDWKDGPATGHYEQVFA